MKIAFFGAGRISYFHCEAFREAGASVVGVCTRGESGKEFAQKQDVPYFSGAQSMIEETQPDAVALLTQPSSYSTILREVQAFGLPVFMEKPIAHSAAEAEALKSLLPEKVFVGQNRRFYSNMQPIRELVAQGEPLSVHAHICERAKDIALRGQRDRDTWHVMNGIHLIDLIKDLFGMPTKFEMKMGWKPLPGSSLNTYNHAVYQTEAGHRVHFNSNFDSPGGWRMNVFSAAQEVSVFPIEKTVIKRIGEVIEVPLVAEDTKCKQGFVAQSRCFIEGVQSESGELPHQWVSFDDALESVALTETLYA